MALEGRQAEFNTAFRDLLAKFADEDIISIIPPPAPEEVESDESSVVNQIEAAAQYLGGYICDYQDGVLDVCIRSAMMAKEFSNFLDNFLPVDDYDIYEVTSHDESPIEDQTYIEIDHESYEDWSSIPVDSTLDFQFLVYLVDELVDGDDVIIDADEDPDEENGQVFEVMKVVKINFKGKKTIRMKCQPGYKYDSHQHACVKRAEHDIFVKRRKAQLNMLRRTASKAAIKKKINHKSLRFLLNRKRLGIGY